MHNHNISDPGNVGENRLMSLLPVEIRQRIAPQMQLVELKLGDVLYDSDRKLSHAYFPTTAIVSLMHVLEDGASTEFAVVGNDGMLGVALLMDVDTMPSQAVVQSSGFAYRLPAAVLKQEFNQFEQMAKLLLRYVQFLFTQVAQMAVCNRRHAVQQQLSRWLLVNLDRLPANQLQVTQEAIASMLGVRREAVTEAASKLRSRELISYNRGRITVLDRAGLEATTCECYHLVSREYQRLLSKPQPTVVPESPICLRIVKKAV